MGYTQAKLAPLCDITPQYLSLLELGEVNVSLDTLMAISTVLNEPLSSLVARAEKLQAGQHHAPAAKSGKSTRPKKSEAVTKAEKPGTDASGPAAGKATRRERSK